MGEEERAAGAQQPDRRDYVGAAGGVPRGAAGRMRLRLREQRRVSFLHRRNPLQNHLARR